MYCMTECMRTVVMMDEKAGSTMKGCDTTPMGQECEIFAKGNTFRVYEKLHGFADSYQEPQIWSQRFRNHCSVMDVQAPVGVWKEKRGA